MNSIIGAGAAYAGRELFGKAVYEVQEYIKKHGVAKLRQWSTEKQINTLYSQIMKVRKVKTIWQVDKTVDLMEFYCDSYVLWSRKRRKITRVSDLQTEDNILIEGIAGQGKSILLRYLCGVELILGNYVPVFLELRRISKEQPLKARIFATFEALGLNVDDALFGHLARSGKILLLLDAFDEIPDDLKASVLTDIEDLAAKYDRLRILVTSRPQHDIRVSNHFAVVTLDNLAGDEYTHVIRKLAGKQTWATALINHIETKAGHIRGLLCTPLMVTLLVLSYKSCQILPNKLSEFYDALFQTLLQRHDGSKPGFTRERRCALDDNQYRVAFETLCILAKKRGQQSYDNKTMYELARQTLSQCGYSAIPSKYVDDIVKITCLIIRDGEEYRFIHKTVQEYYTASYIQRRPDVWAAEFYGKVLENDAYYEWNQELAFLSEIDTYRYNKYYLLPGILRDLDISETQLDGALGDMYKKWPRRGAVGVEVSMHDKNAFTVSSDYDSHLELTAPGLIDAISNRVLTLYDMFGISKREYLRVNYNRDGFTFHKITTKGVEKLGEKEIMGRLYYGEITVGDELFEAVNDYRGKLLIQARNIRDALRGEENPTLLDGLI